MEGNNDTVLSAGNYVVIDLNHLFYEQEVFQNPDLYHIFKTSKFYYYESLYQESLKYKNISLDNAKIKEKTTKN